MLERGNNWMVTDPVNVQLFDTTGVRGELWRINGNERPPVKVSVKILQLIRRIAGRIYSREIVGVQVSQEVGVMLYLEEVLTLEHLKRATETQHTIVCEGVELGGVPRRVVIERGRPSEELAVIDQYGTVLS